jgi:hypothetical protein
MNWQSALPPYPGGKRWARAAIFGLLDTVYPRASWPGLVFCDAFVGGCSVALAAKRLGFRQILANDLATRSVITGRALVENSTAMLAPCDVLRLFDVLGSRPVRPTALLGCLPRPLGDFLARAWPYAETYPGPKADLVRLVLIKWTLSFFPLGLPSATDSWRIRDSDLDPVTSPRLNHYLSRQKQMLNPSYLLKLAGHVNAGVFPGEARVCQQDVFRFLPGVQADVLYLDPPFGGTQSYERAFRLLDEFIGDDHEEVSSFSGRRPPIDELLDACRHIPVLILSLGNALSDEEGVRALVSRHRRVLRVLSVPYRHYGAVASSSKSAGNREFLALGTLK